MSKLVPCDYCGQRPRVLHDVASGGPCSCVACCHESCPAQPLVSILRPASKARAARELVEMWNRMMTGSE